MTEAYDAHTTPVTGCGRRNLFAAAAAMIAAPAALAATPGTHPDVELLNAWRDYCHAWQNLNAVGDSGTDEQHQPLYGALELARGRLNTLPANTVQGASVKLNYLMMMLNESTTMEQTVMLGAPLGDGAFCGDYRLEALWNLSQELQDIAGAA